MPEIKTFDPDISNIFAMDQLIDDNDGVVGYPTDHTGSVRTLEQACAEHAAMRLASDNGGRVHRVLSA